MISDEEACNPGRKVHRPLSIKKAREFGKPLADLSGFVLVYDVVNISWLSMLNRPNCSAGCIIHVHERSPPGPIADQRHAAPTDLLHHDGLEDAGGGSVERSIAQNNAFGR